MTYEEIISENRQYCQSVEFLRAQQDEAFDKHIIAFASGSFGISFAFIEKIVPMQSAVHPLLIVIAWACFGMCLILELIGFRISSYVHEKTVENANDVMQVRLQGKDADYKRNWKGLIIIDLQNLLSLFLFIGGIVCLILFIALNVLR